MFCTSGLLLHLRISWETSIKYRPNANSRLRPHMYTFQMPNRYLHSSARLVTR